MIFIEIIVFAILIGGSVTGIYILLQQRNNRMYFNWENSRKYKTLKILVPKENEKGPSAAEQMFASLHGVFKEDERFQDQISFELAAREKFIQFYVRVPEHLTDFVEGQIYAQYPEVEISQVTDYVLDNYDDKEVTSCELLLNKDEVFPLKSFTTFDVDPLSAITSVLGKIDHGEEIWIQIIIKPVSDKWQNKGIAHISAVKSGRITQPGVGIFQAIIKGFFRLFLDIIKTAGSSTAQEGGGEAPQEIKLSGIAESGLKEIERKITKLGFETKIRIICLAPKASTAISKINSVAGVFKQFNVLMANGFKASQVSIERNIISSYRNRSFANKGYILNIEELASLYHLPTTSVETPHIVWAGSKKGEPPSNLPIIESTPLDELTVFAKTDFRNIEHKFGIKTRDRGLHMYAIGKTGTGKSTMLENMVIDDIRAGRGVAVVDPHGDLISHVLDFIPENRVDDVIYFNPIDKDYPIGFNLLDNVNPDLKNIVASGVVGIFKKIFGESWGPRLEYILRNAVLALLDYPDATMLGIMRLLVDKDFRKDVVSHVKDPVIRDYFVNEFEKYDPKFRTEAISPIQNKVGQFLSSSTIRNIVGQPKSTFDMREAMDSGKILLLDLSIGKIGEDSASLLGAMMITKIQLAAMQRADLPEAERKDFYLYVDEFQNFATESFAVILSEARKYHLNLIMTNQYISQMLEPVSNAIFGNVGTLISFRVGAQDATSLLKEFEPVFDANDMVNLGNYSVYVKMAIDGVTRPAFSAITLPPHHGKTDQREKVIKLSREKYGKDLSIVEEQVRLQSEIKKDAVVYINNVDYMPEPKVTKDGYSEVTDIANNKWYIQEEPSNEKEKQDVQEKGTDQSSTLILPEDIVEEDSVTGDDTTELKAGETVKIEST